MAQTATLSSISSNTTWVGSDSSVNVTYTLSNADNNRVFLQVYDSIGLVVRTINAGLQGNGAHTITWNGLYDNGTHVPEGDYMLKVIVDDSGAVPSELTNQWTMYTPYGIATDSDGNMYIADASLGNGTIRIIYTNGTITTRSSGLLNPYGIASDSIGNLYVAESGDKEIKKIFPNGTVTTFISGFGTSSARGGVAVDSNDNVYIADYNSSVVKEIFTDGTNITLGSGFKNPWGIAVDSTGNVYVADYGNKAIKKIPAGNGTPVTLADSTNGLGSVSGVTVDSDGNVYISDFSGKAVKVIYAGTTAPVTLASGFGYLSGVAVGPDGSVYTLDTTNSAVYKISSGITSVLYNNYFAGTYQPIAAASNGNVYVGDTLHKTIKILYSNGTMSTIQSSPVSPVDICTDTSGNIYAADTVNKCILKIYPNGTTVQLAGGFSSLNGIAVDLDGNVYVADTMATTITVIHPDGSTTTVGSGLFKPYDITLDSYGNALASCTGGFYFKIFTNGTVKQVGEFTTNALFFANDPDGNIYVDDAGDGTIYILSPDQSSRTTLTTGLTGRISIDPLGNLYIFVAGKSIQEYSVPCVSSGPLTLHVELAPPATSCTLDGNLVSGVYQGKVTANLSAADSTSGVNYTMYSLDGVAWSKYIHNVSISATGSYTLYYYSVDNAGNAEPVNSVSFDVEGLPVALTINGRVSYPMSLTMDDLHEYPNVTVDVTYGSNHLTGVGISLNDLLNDSAPLGTSTSIMFMASDYTATVSLASVRADPDAVIFYDSDESLRNVIPSQGSAKLWVRNLTTITISSAVPATGFTPNVTTGPAPLTVQFTDTSTNYPEAWSWDFGDGNTSTLKSPAHTYTMPGTYDVSLTATNAAGSNTTTRTKLITVSQPPQGAQPFTLSLNAGWNLVSIPLVDDSLWASQLNGTGVTAVATYNKASNAFDPYVVGKSPLSDDKQITIDNAYYMYCSQATSLTIYGTESPGHMVSLSQGWNMIGWSMLNTSNAMDVAGSISGDQAIARYNTARGAYDPYVEPNSPAEDSFAMHPGEGYFVYMTNSGYLTFGEMPPVAAFSASTTNGGAPLTVHFTDQSIGATSWSWDFGDGNTSTLQNPTNTYGTPGIYTVSLTATNDAGSNTTVKTGYINVTTQEPVILTVTGAVKKPLNLTMSDLLAYPQIAFNTSYTKNNTLYYLDVSGASLNTILDDAEPAGSATGATFIAPDYSATYTISEIRSDTQCIIAINSPPDGSLRNVMPNDQFAQRWVYDLTTIRVNQPSPVASFTSNVTDGPSPLYVQFTDTSTNDPTSWSWSFGDGGSSTVKNPTHRYSLPGTYTVRLTVQNSAGTNTVTVTNYVTVSQGEPIVFTVNGSVSNPLYLTMSDLLAYPQLTENVSYVKVTGPTVYYVNVTGPLLNAILNDAGVPASATTAQIDGQSPDGTYGAGIYLDDIRNDPNAIIAIYPDGSLRDIIPSQGMQCVWMYNLTYIKVN